MVRKLYNPEAKSTNLHLIHKTQTECCGEDIQVCEYSRLGVDYDFGITSIHIIEIVDGVAVETSWPTSGGNGVGSLRQSIRAALIDAGYDPDGNDAVIVTPTSQVLATVKILGEANVSQIGGAVTTQNCVLETQCDLSVVLVATVAATPLVVNIQDGAGTITEYLASASYADETALETALNGGSLAGVVVTDNAGVWTVAIPYTANVNALVFEYGDNSIVTDKVNCVNVYV